MLPIKNKILKGTITERITPSVVVFIGLVLISLLSFKIQMKWINNPFSADVNQYYSYLVAQFIHHDFNFHFPHNFWLIQSPDGEVVPKVTMGMAILYFPFFICGHAVANILHYPCDGYSLPYAWLMHFGTLLYFFIAIWFLRKTLLNFFSEWVTSITLFLIVTGTNLFYYVYKEGEMAHSYLFFLFSLFLYFTVKWHIEKTANHLCKLAFVLGLITLIRPTEFIIIIVFLLYNITGYRELVFKIKELLRLRWKLCLCFAIFFTPIIPQLLYWHKYTGHYLFFSYGSNEHFFFNDPKLHSVLFGWHKGWFLYTPLALFMIAGLLISFFYSRKIFYPIFIYITLNIYLISCWWDWGFGGAYGMRALVQCYALLALPLAYFINFVFSIKVSVVRKVTVACCSILFLVFVSLNIFHFWLIKNSLFHWDSMSKEAYKYTLFKTGYSDTERKYLLSLLKHPNYEAMRKGERDEK